MSAETIYPDAVQSQVESDIRFDLRLDLLELVLGASVNQATQRLADHAQCVALSASMRGKLCEQMAQHPTRSLQAGERLYLTGNPARSVFLVQSGLIKANAISSEGQELTLRLYRAGDIVGELCLCGGGRREEATALEQSAVSEIPLPSMLGLLSRDPGAALELVSLLCDRLADAYEQMESLSWDTVLYRLVRTLLRLADDLGETSGREIRLTHYIRQEELALIVGARREVVSSLLNRLRASGHISYSPRGAITIHRGALQAFLDARAGG